ncbi:hypothetical protein [Leeuwenhoekiella nanhaiensis]|uniref:NADH:ubiquinone oxidoreductase intermediate-associated protein 30 domain-containing protein n=1 Tax=Leeuwenhoekiella nanhaiensis TaxID=1655491 RepID=A0A2G1VMD9_9FLAO|nr:hypothetical protein [Leeuwenhoekiella nanhaiensis]PHQ27894.1 hypothetical protein CJ305_17660 [Leeuwenhoekiella nanhaiensis]
MKKILFLLAIVFSIAFAEAQQIWDDFTTGPLKQITTLQAEKIKIEQPGENILGGTRYITYNVTENPYQQLFQLAIQKGALISSTGFGTASSMSITYGGNRERALNMDLSQYKTIKIAFKGESNFARVYLNMWSNGANRAFWRGNKENHVPFHGSINAMGVNSEKVISIPLEQLTTKDATTESPSAFNIADVDSALIQFYGFPATGVNYAIDKIWVE